MALPLQVNNITYQYPEDITDVQWGEDATGWAETVTELCKIFRSVSSNDLAQIGAIRLPNLEKIAWRNAANSDDTFLYVNGSNKLIFDDGSNTFDLTSLAAGNVTNSVGSSSDALARYDGVTGQIIKNSVVTLDDLGEATGFTNILSSDATITFFNSTTATITDLQVTGTLFGAAVTALNNSLMDIVPSAVDNALIKLDGTSGKVAQTTGIIVSDTDDITGVANLSVANINISDGTLSTIASDFADAVYDAYTRPTTLVVDPGVRGVVFSLSSGTYTTASTAFNLVTNLSVPLTTGGKPVRISLQAWDSNPASVFTTANVGGGSFEVGFRIDGGIIQVFKGQTFVSGVNSGIDYPPGAFSILYSLPAGAHTFEIYMRSPGGVVTVGMENVQLVVHEL